MLMEHSQNPLLHRIISTLDLDFARQLIGIGANIEVQNSEKDTPILALAGLQISSTLKRRESECLELAKELALRGADIHAFDQRSRSLCHKAASTGKVEFLEWALEILDLNPALRDSHSRTHLLLAVESGSVGAVNLLINHLLKSQNRNGHANYARLVESMEYANMRSAPLLRAMVGRSQRKITVVAALVEADNAAFSNLDPVRQADLVSLRTSFYIKGVTWAIDCDFSDCFTYLLPKIPKAALSSHRNIDGDAILHVAVAAGNIEYLKTLLQSLASQDNFGEGSLNTVNAKNMAPLDIAIECGSEEKASFLLLHGVKPSEAQCSKARQNGFVITTRADYRSALGE